MKFGLFCLTFQYFRAMTLVRREKISWTDAGEQIGAEVGARLGSRLGTDWADDCGQVEAVPHRPQEAVHSC